MSGLVVQLERDVMNNRRKMDIIYTNPDMQLAYMSLRQGETIPRESHHGSQFIRVEDGNISVNVIDRGRFTLVTGDAIIIPMGVKHEITAQLDTKMYTIYSPPAH